jgi:Dyp-type peroxidase family
MAQAKGVLPTKGDDREVLYKNLLACGYFISVRLRRDVTSEQVQQWLSGLDAAVDALVARAVPEEGQSKGRKLASAACGFAPSFFDLVASVGIGLEGPAGFTVEAAPPTPRFATAPERQADALFYIVSVSEYRVEQFLRNLAASAAVESVSLDRGYQRADETEPFGYRDGVRNVRSSDRSKVVFVHRNGGQPDEPVWADGGTYMTTIKILQNPAVFEALGADAQNAVIGRTKDGTRLDLPAGTDPRQEGPDPADALPPASHVRKAGPRGHHDDNQIFRRGLPFVEVADGRVQVGLHFCSFQASPNQFDAVLNDWMMNIQFPPRTDGTTPGQDALIAGTPAGAFVEMKDAGIYFVPPYDPDGIAAALKPHESRKPKSGQIAVNKVVKDPNDPGRRFERAGFSFEVRDATGAVVPGSQFTTGSNGRGVCDAKLPLDQDYTLVETASVQPNIALQTVQFRLEKPNLLIRVENVFNNAPPGYGSL